MGKFRKIGIFVWVVLFCFGAGGAYPGEETGQSEIKFLINHLSTVNAEFVRNGKIYSCQDGYQHIIKKYKYFAKKNKIVDGKSFIKYAATKSLISNKPYFLIVDENPVELSRYLSDLLLRFQSEVLE